MQNYLCHCERSEAISNPCDEPHPTGECFVSLRSTRNDNIQLILHEYLYTGEEFMKNEYFIYGSHILKQLSLQTKFNLVAAILQGSDYKGSWLCGKGY
ncbi:MAG: hypothetical protein HC787_02475 [Nostocaceae cyanobacterium CSU_2_110]|nr:hypothetical protein [Nostocaceae cyanobacterium CSU_2_110]